MGHSNTTFSFHSDIVLRTPLLPLQNELMAVAELLEYSKQVFFKEAIYLASPILYSELIKWHSGEIKDPKEIDKLVVSLTKYCSRMQSRCTPYGLFAGCSVAAWGDETNVVLDKLTNRHTRLDMNFVCALAQKLNLHPSISPQLKFYPNNSIYVLGDQMRYVEYSYVKNRRVHQITSIEDSQYLRIVIGNAVNGATVDELTKLLLIDGISITEAKEFVYELIGNQVLVSELEPSVTGDEFIYQIISLLKKLKLNDEIEAIIELLISVQENIVVLDENRTNDVGLYKSIYKRLDMLGVSIEESNLFQTDLYKNAETATIASDIKNNLNEAIDFLSKISAVSQNLTIQKFKDKFYKRYENAELPLLELLDNENGIGYPNNDIAGVNDLLDDINSTSKTTDEESLKWNKVESFLHAQLQKAIKENVHVVNIKEDDIKIFDDSSAILPDSMAIMFRIVGNNKIHFQYAGGSSAANLLGRFAHGDKGIRNIISDITEHEQGINKSAILAEIVHLPESRIGNILLRPVFREYEIPYLGKSSLPEDKQIKLQDLFISIKNDKIVLRSKKLNKEIIPRLSTAHNYSFNALPVYQFLCDLQTQYFEKPTLIYTWGVLQNNYRFLPRVEYKNVILSRASWKFDKVDFQVLLNESQPEYMHVVGQWCERNNLPQFVVLADSDNELLVNFKDIVSVRMFVSSIKKRENITVEEHLLEHSNLKVKDSFGKGYANECIAIRLNNNVVRETNIANVLPVAPKKDIQREFSLGSEWIYYKVYCGVKTSDKILSEVIKPIVDEIMTKGLADKFFFIRYADPEVHIRIRFHLTDTEKIGEIVAVFHKGFSSYISSGVIQKVCTDVYKRELERYGDNSMELSETLFCIDSLTTLNMLSLIDSGGAGSEIRWQFAILSIDELLTSFGYTDDERISFVKKMSISFFYEHGGSKELKIQLDAKFRSLRKLAENILNREHVIMGEMAPLIDVLKWKQDELIPVANAVVNLKKSGLLKLEIDDLIASYIHMLVNRVFMGRQRACEMIMYDFLYRYYTSVKARDKNRKELKVA